MGDPGAGTGGGDRRVPGTAGYAEAADLLAVQYEAVTFEQVHHEVLHLVPAGPGRVLDVGAGTGRDAAALAARGHRVVAVEPTTALRRHGRRLHPGTGIDWVDDSLPELSGARDGQRFDAVFATAVWMHLDPAERSRALARIAELLAPGGRFFVQLRHGPVPAGRRMFEVSAADTVAAARALGLRLLHRSERPDLHGRDGVRWSSLVLQAGGGAERV
ncbi:class I SAM-dependent methyltransferase [Kitasatospora sp. DSM 101779]|uniref:class I SAM-dependent methyltransferase n=1 Tax=Kitasatospora sp. DSM 101779 TaxID=2853165 RepID=UPI0021DB769D|nr:class I SAM-dependent methyltransferase [Kitasatospora sp. DSM 101779]MCU7820447.1 class I SAM-dependent methyltransferase [Kitasatospora sp. DSM 101779]